MQQMLFGGRVSQNRCLRKSGPWEERVGETRNEKSGGRDLTGLYDPKVGRKLVGEYLLNRDPYTSCGMLAVNVDDFKAINEEYGHFAGDQVLVILSEFFLRYFGENGIVIRSGGDEFMIFMKNISHKELVKQTVAFMEALRTMQFPWRAVW